MSEKYNSCDVRFLVVETDVFYFGKEDLCSYVISYSYIHAFGITITTAVTNIMTC